MIPGTVVSIFDSVFVPMPHLLVILLAPADRTFLYLNGLPNGTVVAPHFNPFNVWKETSQSGKHLNFLTGAGGFLQVQYWSGYQFLLTVPCPSTFVFRVQEPSSGVNLNTRVIASPTFILFSQTSCRRMCCKDMVDCVPARIASSLTLCCHPTRQVSVSAT